MIQFRPKRTCKRDDKTQEKPQNFTDTLADRKVQTDKWKVQQEDRPKVLCEGEPIEIYLQVQVPRIDIFGGRPAIFRHWSMGSNGDEALRPNTVSLWLSWPGTKVKNQTVRRYNMFLTHIWMWIVDTDEQSSVNSQWHKQSNSVKSDSQKCEWRSEIRDHVQQTTIWSDISVKPRWLRWLGYILREFWGTDNTLSNSPVCIQDHLNLSGNLLMNVPRHENMERLSIMAKDKSFWKEQSRLIWEIRKLFIKYIYLFHTTIKNPFQEWRII